jgi:hypothetical protein
MERPATSDQTLSNVNVSYCTRFAETPASLPWNPHLLIQAQIPEFDWSDPDALTKLLAQSQEWSVHVFCGSRAQEV